MSQRALIQAEVTDCPLRVEPSADPENSRRLSWINLFFLFNGNLLVRGSNIVSRRNERKDERLI